MKLKFYCFIGLECPAYPCKNYGNCLDLSYSWSIPFYRNKHGLFVKQCAYRYEWTVYASPFTDRCLIESEYHGYYKTLDDGLYGDGYYGHHSEMNQRVMQSWNEAGFYPAWDIDCKPIEIDDVSEDDIPF
jgi:hypothetical protein